MIDLLCCSFFVPNHTNILSLCNWSVYLQAGDTDLNQLNDFGSKAVKVFASSLCNSKSLLWYNGRFRSEGMNFFGWPLPLSFSILETSLIQILLLMQKFLADILSVLAMTLSAEGERVCCVSFWIYVPVIRSWSHSVVRLVCLSESTFCPCSSLLYVVNSVNDVMSLIRSSNYLCLQLYLCILLAQPA